jgi:uncharacterized protein YpiB (UPF0302 family)
VGRIGRWKVHLRRDNEKAGQAKRKMALEIFQQLRLSICSLLETVEVLSDKKLLQAINESLGEANKGRGRSLNEILAELSRTSSGIRHGR